VIAASVTSSRVRQSGLPVPPYPPTIKIVLISISACVNSYRERVDLRRSLRPPVSKADGAKS
jgi:hypothetical protein